MKKFHILFLLPFMLIACKTPENNKNVVPENEIGQPNIIFLIGDGMGLSQVSSMFYFNKDNTNFGRFNHIGLINTSSASDLITDSGASGTALATGHKTYNGAIGVDADTNSVPSMLELLSGKGYFSGLVSTSSITHATPASFYAHVDSRKKEDDIAAQLVHSPVDFFAGGGIKFFAKRSDGLNYLDSLTSNGFTWDTTSLRKQGLAQEKKYGFLLSNDGMPKEMDDNKEFISAATALALDYLSGRDKPFFLMVEGSQIDWAGHGNDSEYLISEMKQFDKCVGLALDFAEKNGNTLVVVTADHETGGFTLAGSYAKDENGKKKDYNSIDPAFATGGHSATLIPLFSFGEGAETFHGIYQHNLVFDKIMNVAK